VRGADIDLASDLGRIDSETAEAQRRGRADAIARLRRRLGLGPDADTRELLAQLLREMSASEASSVLVSLEDLWTEEEPQNTPGTTDDERPNWRRRAARSVEEIDSSKDLADELGQLARLRRDAQSE
jgi:4-alpha-glucanotransferase